MKLTLASITIAVATAGALLLSAPSPVQGDPELLEVIGKWEEANGREARAKLLTRIGMARIPPRQDSLRIAFEGLNSIPYGEVSAEVAQQVEMFKPLLDGFGGLWGMPSSATISDPDSFFLMPEIAPIMDGSKILTLRGVMHSKKGEEIPAATDFATAWIAGRAMEEFQLCTYCLTTGLNIRIVALRYLLHEMESGSMTAEEWEGFVATLSNTVPETPTNIFATLIPTFRIELEDVKRSNQQFLSAITQHGDTLLQLMEQMETANPVELNSLMTQFAEASREARRSNSMLGGIIPDLQTQLHLMRVGNAMECIFHVSAAAYRSEWQGNTPTSIADLEAALGPRKWAMIDPFSGNPLRFENHGNGKYTIASCGPDGAFTDGTLTRLAVFTSPDATGDILFRRP